jgi:hypothetical protein
VVDATPSELKALITGGVYERTEAKRAFCGAESRAVETLESKSVNEIGRALGKDHLVVHVLAGHGGVAWSTSVIRRPFAARLKRKHQ